ncbi:MAG TPA: sulfatase [Prosthecobacter sp.]|nr:sulfatase [Prosthecobacter sp.]HRK13521.1 sulfatase [Prosthecobacter sp.]
MLLRGTLILLLCAPAFQAASAAAPKSKSAYGKPNVLFIIADDLRDYTGWLGGHPQARTPHMDRLASMGMRFANAHCSYALCNPSRTSLMTGMAPASSGVFGNEQDWRRSVQITGKTTLPEHLRAMGFLTAAAGKIFHANHGGPEARLAGWHGGRRGFEQDAAWERRFPAPGVQIPEMQVRIGQDFNGLGIWHWDWGALDLPDELTDDGAVTQWAGGFLKQKQRKPFFLAVGLYKPHSPWYVPRKYFDPHPLDETVLPEVRADDLDDVPAFAKGHEKQGGHHALILARDKWREAVQAYLANVAFCDARLGELLAALESGPNARNTIVIFTSDHGWYLGEKQMWHKGKLWEEATHVPLTVHAPGLTKPDSVSGEAVSLLDLYPTVCDLLKVAKPKHLDGESLLPLLKDPSAKRARPAITAMGGADKASYAARDRRWRYIRYSDGGEELYDHDNDPNEWTNLASLPEHEAVKKELAAHFPKVFQSARRPAGEIVKGPSQDGSEHLELQIGDELSAGESPKLAGRGVFVDAAFDFNPEVDMDSTLVGHGDAKLGWVLHLVDSAPVFTVFINGKAGSATISPLKAGPCQLRATLDYDGLISLAEPGRSEVLERASFTDGFPGNPGKGIAAGQSFGILNVKDYPNSTPFDGAVRRLRVTFLPPVKGKP